MVSLMQTPNRIAGAAVSLSDPFIPLVRACAKSRVWKVRAPDTDECRQRLIHFVAQIRDKAADALTALVPALEIVSTCLDILVDVESCRENEVSPLLP